MSDSNSSEHHISSISSFVSYFLLIVGLSAEFLAIETVVDHSHLTMSFSQQTFLYLSIIVMLLHQFLTIRNFHIIDHLSVGESKKIMGSWVTNSKLERFLRFTIFSLFSCLTGEIVYLIIVSSKSIKFINHNLPIEGGKYDLSWITPFYLICALLMSLLILLWNCAGMLHEWEKLPSPFKIRPSEVSDKIVFAPSSSPYYIFIISDFFSVLFWALLNVLVFTHKDDATIFILILFTSYGSVITARIYCELKALQRRISSKKNMQKMSLWNPEIVIAGNWKLSFVNVESAEKDFFIENDERSGQFNGERFVLEELKYDLASKTISFCIAKNDERIFYDLSFKKNSKYLIGKEKKNNEIIDVEFKRITRNKNAQNLLRISIILIFFTSLCVLYFAPAQSRKVHQIEKAKTLVTEADSLFSSYSVTEAGSEKLISLYSGANKLIPGSGLRGYDSFLHKAKKCCKCLDSMNPPVILYLKYAKQINDTGVEANRMLSKKP